MLHRVNILVIIYTYTIHIESIALIKLRVVLLIYGCALKQMKVL